MAATVIDNYSDDLKNGVAPVYGPVKTNVQGGRIRVAYFQRTYATEAAGDDTALVILPKGARILNGEISVSATTGTATLAVGLMDRAGSGFIDAALSVSDNTAYLLAAAAITTTAKVALAATQALGYGYETEKELYVTITTAAAAMASQVIKGHITYVVD